jgi:hypothetical protein
MMGESTSRNYVFQDHISFQRDSSKVPFIIVCNTMYFFLFLFHYYTLSMLATLQTLAEVILTAQGSVCREMHALVPLPLLPLA